jgi:hypothetical protein
MVAVVSAALVASSNELLPELPAYWSKSRDAVLSQTMMREPFWAGAVKKTISKGATQQYDFKFKERNRMSAERFRELFKTSNGRQGFKHLLNQGLQDYFLTDNGFFIEIDREDNSKPGSRIIGLYHLDSLRCWRTGDRGRAGHLLRPARPVPLPGLVAGLEYCRHAQRPQQLFRVGFWRRLPCTNASGAWWRSASSSIKG